MQWNHNIHYHPMILKNLPRSAQSALDVGCGDGTLTRQLGKAIPRTVGIDQDQASINLAKTENSVDVEYVLADFLTYACQPESFDVIVSVATLHHMDINVALTRMRDLLRPGGRLVIVGLARSQFPIDFPFDLASVVAGLLRKITTRHRPQPSPTMPPMQTYAEVRRIAARLLPGSRYRRHLYWRYSLVWTKPPFDPNSTRSLSS